MVLRYVPILKAKPGELTAVMHTRRRIADRIRPLFEIIRLADGILRPKYLATSPTPTLTYLDRTAASIVRSWGTRAAMVDGYYWPPDALTESGEHVIAYMLRQLRNAGLPIVPVVGYDRWENAVYRAGMMGVGFASEPVSCLRLDSQAIEDSAEPEFFCDNVTSILDGLDLFPERCQVLLVDRL